MGELEDDEITKITQTSDSIGEGGIMVSSGCEDQLKRNSLHKGRVVVKFEDQTEGSLINNTYNSDGEIKEGLWDYESQSHRGPDY